MPKSDQNLVDKNKVKELWNNTYALHPNAEGALLHHIKIDKPDIEF